MTLKYYLYRTVSLNFSSTLSILSECSRARVQKKTNTNLSVSFFIICKKKQTSTSISTTKLLYYFNLKAIATGTFQSQETIQNKNIYKGKKKKNLLTGVCSCFGLIL
ncbi:GSCOCG00010374001-RA-CDS [Cotesia congregata]|nr:GSCOCG00010374001-RA-CDS [Cotesia congregata]